MPAEPLIERVQALLAGDDPVSFYDAMAVTRAARRLRDLSAAAMAAVLALHDHAHTTDGGREVLADLLRACAQRFAGERERAARPLTLSDHNTTVRAAVGATLHLALAERRGQGCRWRPARVNGPLACEDDGGEPGFAAFSVRLVASGRGEVLMTEDVPAGGSVTPCDFVLHVVVESAR